MKKKIILTLVLSLFMVSSVAAVSQENLPTSQSDSGDFTQGDIGKQGFFDSLSSALFSFSDVQSSYEPGETVDIRVEAEATETFNVKGSETIVNLYKCADSGCDDAPPIDSSSEDQCDSEEWWPEYDDCIGHHSHTGEFDFQILEGETYGWGVEFDAPQDEATYILVGYIFKDGFVTDTSREKFTVEAAEPEPEPDPVVNVDEVDGDIPVSVSNGEITATPEFVNTGDADMSSSDIVEMQVRPEDSGLLSFVSSVEGTCDSGTPENVHKEFRLDAGDSREISLSTSTSNVEGGQKYDVWIVTREECGGAQADPYGTGVIADTVFVEASDPDGDGVKGDNDLCPKTAGSKEDGCPVEPRIEQASKDIEISVDDSTVTSKITLLNTADETSGIDGVLNPDEGDMKESNIIEMQVRPQGKGLLSTTSTSVQDVCDSSTPENVHKEFQIEASDQLEVTLTTQLSDLQKGKSYDVWIVTRQDCGGGPASPYGTGIKAGNFEYSENTSTEICGNGKDDDGDGKVDEDCGNDLPVVPIVAGVLIVVAGGVYRFYG